MVAITITSEYGLVIWAAVSIIVECAVFSASIGSYRRRIFNQEFMEREFGEEHKKATGQRIAVGGFPDTGNGWYSKKLSYKDWYDFNNAQRAHLNLVEFIFIVLPLLLLGGLYEPFWSAVAGFTFFLGRILYSIGYKAKGPQGRLVGALISEVALLPLLYFTVRFGYNLYTA